MSRHYQTAWINYAAPVFMLVYLAVGVFLAFSRHNSFHTDLLDLGYYTQIVWNTSQGRPFGNFIPPNPPISLADHFSVTLALIAPLFWIAPDARTLQFTTVLCLTLAMIPAYLIVREKYPGLAPLVVLGLALNPMGNQVSSMDFHEIMLATPVLAFTLYALHKRNNHMLLACLALALLVREDMGLFVASFGLFLVLFRKGQRIAGALAIVIGVAWTVVIIQWAMPTLGMQYRHINTFNQLGDSLGQVAVSMLDRLPREIVGLVSPVKLQTYLKLFLPFAFLPLLAAGEQVLWVPGMLIILFTPTTINQFTLWHISAFLGLLWVSVGIVIARLPSRWARIAVGALILTSIIGYFVWGWYPGGRNYDPSRYAFDEHAAIGQTILAQIPADTPIAAQSRLAVHLAARRFVALFPWLDPDWTPKMILLDEQDANPYPLTQDRLKKFIQEYEARPSYKIALEQDGYFIFEPDAQNVAPVAQPWEWPGLLRLENFSITQADQSKAYQPVDPAHQSINPARTVRVELYWQSLAAMDANYAISVRLLTPDGQTVAQDDSWPARGLLSTLQWPVGQRIRDVHYLQVPDQQLPAVTKLQVVVYNWDTKQRAVPQDGYTITEVGAP